MKKSVNLAICCVLSFMLILAGCGGKGTAADGRKQTGSTAVAESENSAAANGQKKTVVFTEKMFLAQYNDVILNSKDYKDVELTLEGMCDLFTQDDGSIATYVYRNGPGCCGADGYLGFEFTCSDKPELNQNDWIEVRGEVAFKTIGGTTYPYLKASAVTVKQQRGADTVY